MTLWHPFYPLFPTMYFEYKRNILKLQVIFSFETTAKSAIFPPFSGKKAKIKQVFDGSCMCLRKIENARRHKMLCLRAFKNKKSAKCRRR